MRWTPKDAWRRLAEGLPAPFWALAGGLFITRAGSFVRPLLFVYLTQSRGLSPSAAGTVVGLYGVGSLGGSLIGGHLADTWGRRSTMLASLLLAVGPMVLLGLSTDMITLGAMSFLVGLSGDGFRPASQAMVADVVEPRYRMKAFAIQYWVINLGFSVAATVGGLMAKRSFLALFVGDAVATLFLALVVYRLVPETRPGTRTQKKSTGAWAPFQDGPYLTFLILQLLVVLVFFQHLTGLPEDMRAKGLSTEEFGFAVATNGVLIVLFQPLVSRWVAGIPRPVLLAVASSLVGVGFGATSLATTLGQYMLTVAVWTLGEIIFSPVNAAIVADVAPPQLRGRYQGAFSLTWSGGAMIGPVAGPALMEAIGLGPFWLVCLGLGLAVGAAHLALTWRVVARAPAPP